MKEPIHPFLLCRRLPGRLDAEAAATLLGFREHDMALLIGAKLIKPLGKPGQRSVKYFAAKQILELANDPAWLDRATKAVAETWRTRNANRVTTPDSPELAVVGAE